jgi:hypothetical protein
MNLGYAKEAEKDRRFSAQTSSREAQFFCPLNESTCLTCLEADDGPIGLVQSVARLDSSFT